MPNSKARVVNRYAKEVVAVGEKVSSRAILDRIHSEIVKQNKLTTGKYVPVNPLSVAMHLKVFRNEWKIINNNNNRNLWERLE